MYTSQNWITTSHCMPVLPIVKFVHCFNENVLYLQVTMFLDHLVAYRHQIENLEQYT
jgi:hypothetical protein